jgi:hypothetical protein
MEVQVVMFSSIGLAAGLKAFRMAWTLEHQKLAAMAVCISVFCLATVLLPIAARGIGF